MADFDRLYDQRVRTATFDWLTSQCSMHEEVLPRALLAGGFEFDGHRIHMIGPQGIFKPRMLAVPLSITTSPKRPYDDAFGPDYLQYRYRKEGPSHRDNAGLRTAMALRLPLVYFHGVLPGRYFAVWPVYVVGDSPDTETFSIAVDIPVEPSLVVSSDRVRESGRRHRETALRRQYVTVQARQRLHQRAFRERVLEAYKRQCALCRLRHEELLDAAHIIPDSEPDGEPEVSNGLALCRLHHAAFDRFFLGVRPDYTIEIRPGLLVEKDGPTLKHAIQRLHGRPIILPGRRSDHPSIELLSQRYDRFLEAAAI